MASRKARSEPTPGGAWVIGLGAGVAGLLLLTGLVSWDSFKTPSRPLVITDDALSLEGGSGPDAAALRMMKRDFPADYATLRNDMELDHRNGLSRAEREEALSVAIRWFMADHAGEAAAAPDSTLAALADIYAKSLEALAAADPAACERINAAGSQSGLARDPAVSDFLADVTAAQLFAIKAGQASPVERAAPDALDAAALRNAMRGAGASGELTAAVFASGLKGLPEGERCRGSLITYRAIADLPDDQSARWVARLLVTGVEYPVGRRDPDGSEPVSAYQTEAPIQATPMSEADFARIFGRAP